MVYFFNISIPLLTFRLILAASLLDFWLHAISKLNKYQTIHLLPSIQYSPPILISAPILKVLCDQRDPETVYWYKTWQMYSNFFFTRTGLTEPLHKFTLEDVCIQNPNRKLNKCSPLSFQGIDIIIQQTPTRNIKSSYGSLEHADHS